MSFPWHYGPPPPEVPQPPRRYTNGPNPWPPGVYWTLSERDGYVFLLDRYRLPRSQQWRRTKDSRLQELRYKRPDASPYHHRRRNDPVTQAAADQRRKMHNFRDGDHPSYDRLQHLVEYELLCAEEWQERENVFHQYIETLTTITEKIREEGMRIVQRHEHHRAMATSVQRRVDRGFFHPVV